MTYDEFLADTMRVDATYEEFEMACSMYARAHLNQRAGQVYYNVLHDIRPDLADAIVGTLIDPFYKDEVDEQIRKFIRENW